MKRLPQISIPRPQVPLRVSGALALGAVLILGGAAVSACAQFPFNGNPIVWLQAKDHYDRGQTERRQFALDRAAIEFRKAVSMYPKDAHFQYALGETLERQHQFKAAEDALRQSTTLDPHWAQAWFQLGKVLMFEGRQQDAVAATRKAMQADPQNSAAQAQVALILSTLGQDEEAKKVFDSTRQLERDDAEYWFLAGQYFRRQNKQQEAEAAFRQAALKEPAEPEYSEWLGICLYAKKNLQEAVQWLDRATKIDPSSASYWQNLGDCQLALNDREKAEKAYEYVLQLAPSDNTKVRLASMYYQDRKLSQAIPLFQAVLDKYPRNDKVRSLLVNSLLADKQYAQAETCLQGFIQQLGDKCNFETWVYLAGAQQAQGKNGEALASYKRALALKPPERASGLIKRQIQALQADEKK